MCLAGFFFLILLRVNGRVLSGEDAAVIEGITVALVSAQERRNYPVRRSPGNGKLPLWKLGMSQVPAYLLKKIYMIF